MMSVLVHSVQAPLLGSDQDCISRCNRCALENDRTTQVDLIRSALVDLITSEIVGLTGKHL